MRTFVNIVRWSLLAVLAGSSAPILAAPFDLGTFQAPDGAITVTEGGETVEPYFALKALLIAKDAGLDVSLPATRFISWMETDAGTGGIKTWPRFRRSCRPDPGVRWAPCARADADDALLALWLTMLAEMPGTAKGGSNARTSERELAALYERREGVYEINSDTPVALLMDNAEIANTLNVRARLALGRHEPKHAAMLNAQEKSLVLALPHIFPVTDGLPAASTQHEDQVSFYPDQVLPMFLEAENISSKAFKPPLLSYSAWMARYREPWLDGDADAYPWGLVALVADRHKDEDTVTCWLQRAETLRHGAQWNVMEEAVWQALLVHRSFPREAKTC